MSKRVLRARNCLEVAELLGIYKTHNLEDIENGIRKYYEEHGKVPSQISGDASGYVGYTATWYAVNSWLNYNLQRTLPFFCQDLGFDSHWAPHALKEIEEGIRKYYGSHGVSPQEESGDATPYVGYRATWRRVGEWLRGNGHGSLFRFCKERGFEVSHAVHTFKKIEAGVRKYYEEKGEPPTTNRGDATFYMGYRTTWDAVSQWLRNNGHLSPSRLCEKIGFKRWGHNLETVQNGVRSYHKEHKRCPTNNSGDATKYLGFQVTWPALDQWLRGNGHGSLSQLCRGAGFRPYRAQHDLKSIKSGIQKYYKEHGKLPQRDAGDATRYVGYQTTWAAVGSWLNKGSKRVSFSQLCREMGLAPVWAKHEFEKIEEGIRKYHKEHGERPRTTSGDATPYVGYTTTWPTIHSWLCKNGHGTLRNLGTEMGFPELLSAGRLDREAQEIQKFVACGCITNGNKKGHPKGHRNLMEVCRKIQGFFDTHGRRPTQKDFQNEDQWLHNRKCSLKKLCDALGLPTAAYRKEEDVRREVLAYWKEHGKPPIARTGPLSDPQERKMKALDQWLRINGYGSLHQLCMSMGIK